MSFSSFSFFSFHWKAGCRYRTALSWPSSLAGPLPHFFIAKQAATMKTRTQSNTTRQYSKGSTSIAYSLCFCFSSAILITLAAAFSRRCCCSECLFSLKSAPPLWTGLNTRPLRPQRKLNRSSSCPPTWIAQLTHFSALTVSPNSPYGHCKHFPSWKYSE